MNVFYLGAPVVIPLNVIMFTSDFVFMSVTVSQ